MKKDLLSEYDLERNDWDRLFDRARLIKEKTRKGEAYRP
jgi:hypothetical protein